uniref:Glycolipid transfer protein-like n=1 Tax=Gadus morhua TaxID=8049 RepID=A0A8C5AMR7_GADMO
MALLMDHQFRLLPADKQVETRPFLEACSYLPFFIGVSGSSRCSSRAWRTGSGTRPTTPPSGSTTAVCLLLMGCMSQTSSSPCRKVARSRTKNAWRKSESSSTISRLQWTQSTKCSPR